VSGHHGQARAQQRGCCGLAGAYTGARKRAETGGAVQAAPRTRRPKPGIGMRGTTGSRHLSLGRPGPGPGPAASARQAPGRRPPRTQAAQTIGQKIALSLALIAILDTAAPTGHLALALSLALNEGRALLIIANGLRLLRPGTVMPATTRRVRAVGNLEPAAMRPRGVHRGHRAGAIPASQFGPGLRPDYFGCRCTQRLARAPALMSLR
jgi:hypothetical protein